MGSIRDRGLVNDANSINAGAIDFFKIDQNTLNTPYKENLVTSRDGIILSNSNGDGTYVGQICLYQGGLQPLYRLRAGGQWRPWGAFALKSDLIVTSSNVLTVSPGITQITIEHANAGSTNLNKRFLTIIRGNEQANDQIDACLTSGTSLTSTNVTIRHNGTVAREVIVNLLIVK